MATAGLVALVFVAGCDSAGTIPLSLEVKDGAAGIGGKGDEVEIVVKTTPGVDISLAGQTKSLGDKATESFIVAKSGLKLGKNTFKVDAVKANLLGKQTGSASIDWDATPKGLLRVYAVGGDTEATLSCSGTMCGSAAFKATKVGKLGVEVESAIDGTVTLEGQKAPVSPGKRGKLEIDLLGKLPKATVGQTERVSIAIQMEAGGAKADDTLELAGPLLADLGAKELAKAEHGPVAFPGEAPVAGAGAGGEPHMLVAVGVPSNKLIVVGKKGTFAEVDLVAVARPVERFFGCGKTDAAGIIYTDLDVVVFDRRTAKQVGTRKLRADRVSCPPTQTAGQLRGAVREDDIVRVLGELLKK